MAQNNNGYIYKIVYKKEQVNIYQKGFMRLTPGANVRKLFTVVSYELS